MSRYRREPLPTTMALAVTTSTEIGAALISPRGENVRLAILPVLPIEGRRTIVDLDAVATLVKAWRPEQWFVHFHPVSCKMTVREAASRQLSVGALRGLLTGLGVEMAKVERYWLDRPHDAEEDRGHATRRWPHMRAEFTSLPASVAQAAMLAQTARDPRGYYD